MLKKLLAGGALVALAATPSVAQMRNCGTPQVSQLSSESQAILQQIERHTQRVIADQAINPTANRTAATLYTIPVVVHVMYNTTAQNISDAMIQSQLDVLNNDYARTNADASSTPSAFASVAADCQIRFQLATVSPTGAATTGILRKSTSKTYFEYGGADVNGVFVKQSSQGGDDAWNTSQYLNMWVCNFGGASVDLLGYATFPSDAGTYKDGVVMGYKYFGVNPSLGGVYGYGRTATHEVGHWLNLRHIWGDANCGSDLVSDTPTQQTSNGGCPAYPHKTCSNTTNGDMFMNYMDYTNDQCMNIFTSGQKARAQALFVTGGVRVSLTTSPGLGGGGGGGTCAVASGLGSSAISTSGATVSWGAASGATSYNLQYKTSAATTWTALSGLTTTSRALTGLTAATTYQYQVQTVCSAGSAAYSAASSFTTSSTSATYCVSKGTSVAYEYIDKVAIGSIARTSGADAGYYNGTASSTSVGAGTSQTITVSAGFVSTAYSEYFRIYADWNNNGVFTDAGEALVSSAGSTSATDRAFAFTVPAGTSNGAHRLRVVMSDASATSSCGSYSYGETEDYTLNVTGGSRYATVPATSVIGELSVFPNPSQSQTVTLRFVLSGNTAGEVAIRVYDLTGRTVHQQTLAAQPGATEQALPTLPAGLYLVSVRGAAGEQTTKLVVGQ